MLKRNKNLALTTQRDFLYKDYVKLIREQIVKKEQRQAEDQIIVLMIRQITIAFDKELREIELDIARADSESYQKMVDAYTPKMKGKGSGIGVIE